MKSRILIMPPMQPPGPSEESGEVEFPKSYRLGRVILKGLTKD